MKLVPCMAMVRVAMACWYASAQKGVYSCRGKSRPAAHTMHGCGSECGARSAVGSAGSEMRAVCRDGRQRSQARGGRGDSSWRPPTCEGVSVSVSVSV